MVITQFATADSSSVKFLINAANEFLKKAFEQSPNTGNGFGYLVAVLVALIVYDRVQQRLDRKEIRRDKEEASKQAIKDRLAASKAAIAEQESRDAARDRVIEEQRKHRDELRDAFKGSLAPLELRIRDLEQCERKHSEQIVLLRASAGMSPKNDD